MSPARRPRADQPNSAHWESHKDTLRCLYLEDNHPLKRVREIMQHHHDFNATDKMYKYHFKRWKFRKNMTQSEAQRHEADAVAGRGVALPFANGRELGSQRLKMRIHKLSSPDIFIPPTLAIRTVIDHSRQRLKTWDLPNYRPGNTATESWAQDACLAGLAISAGQEARSNYDVLYRSAKKFSSILHDQEPILVWSTCTIIIQLCEVNPDLALGFIKVVLDFCLEQLHPNDPLRILWVAISRTNKNDICRLIAQLAAAQRDFLNEEIGITNPFVIKYIKASAKYLHDRKLIEPSEAHEQIDSIISALRLELQKPGSDNEASTKNQFISANLFQACIYLDNKQWNDVGEILERIEPEVQADFGIDPAQMVNFYEIKAEMLRERGNSARGDYLLSEVYYKLALTTAQQSLSETMPGRIGYILMALVELYKRVENAQKIEETQAQYDEHVKRMAGDVADQLPFAELSISKSEQEE